MAHAVIGDRSTVDWLSWADDYDLVRDGIAKVIPGCDDYNARVRHPGGFYLPNPPRENIYRTNTGKANFTVNPIPNHQLDPGQIVMTTVRSHDQFTTTIYGLHDRYRGMHRERSLVGESSSVQHLDTPRDRFPYSPAFRSSARSSMDGRIRSDEASL